MTDFKEIIAEVATGQPLSRDRATEAFDIMMSGNATPTQIGAFLMGLRVRGETVDEITGAAQIMRSKALPIDAPEGAVDTCGTGGDAKGTYNISTAAAFVVAGAGLPVAKHGNKSISSKSGSADVLASLGVKLDVTPETVATCIKDAGVGFMFAPAHHSAMRHVGPSRAELATRTIFNLLGPLANPAKTKHQVIGVFSEQWVIPLAEVLKNLGSEHVWVVHGTDGLDELTTTAPSIVAELKNGKVKKFEISPTDVGLEIAKEEDLRGGDAEENAEAIRQLLGGEKNAYRDIVVLNAAAALIVGGKADDLKSGIERAKQSIDSGDAKSSLDRLVALTNLQ